MQTAKEDKKSKGSLQMWDSRSSIQASSIAQAKIVMLYSIMFAGYISNLDNERSFSALVSFGKKHFSSKPRP